MNSETGGLGIATWILAWGIFGACVVSSLVLIGAAASASEKDLFVLLANPGQLLVPLVVGAIGGVAFGATRLPR